MPHIVRTALQKGSAARTWQSSSAEGRLSEKKSDLWREKGHAVATRAIGHPEPRKGLYVDRQERSSNEEPRKFLPLAKDHTPPNPDPERCRSTPAGPPIMATS